jgi:hypothetical protein
VSEPVALTEPAGTAAAVDPRRSPRAEFGEGLAWVALGVAIFVGSVTMDRLERQHINPYTAPGLLPALLGLAMILLGGVLTLRSWRRGALREGGSAALHGSSEEWRRIWIVIALCTGYGGVLVGHGLPFWLASAIFVTGSILVLQAIGRDPQARRPSPGVVLKAVVIGLGAGIVTQLVFQEQFLVRLP